MQALRAQFDAQLESLRHQLPELRRRLFGPRSEVIHAGHGRTVDRSGEGTDDGRATSGRGRTSSGSRPVISAALPRRRVEHDLDEAEKAAFVSVERIGEEVSEMLEYIRPGSR